MIIGNNNESLILKQMNKELTLCTEERLGDNWKSILLHPDSKKYFDAIDLILKKYNFNRKDFYLRVLTYLAMYDNISPEYFMKGSFIENVEKKDNNLKIWTLDGIYEVKKLAETLNDPTLLYYKSKDMLLNQCYFIAQIITYLEDLDIETSICNGLCAEKYLHSYNINDNLFIDGSNNLILDNNTFKDLYRPEEKIYRMCAEEFVKDPLFHFDLENKERSAYLIAQREMQKRF